ncbi:MAG: hypothetical protein NHF95_00605 [Candidatus Shikimatogenerans sp. JK-2022]|nr:hypothetical protein [Candidatus Shikimatogenerans bostrichidophilus]
MIKIGINGFNEISKLIIYYTIKKKNIKVICINCNININKIINILNYDIIYNKNLIFSIKKYNNKIIINNNYIINIINIKNIKNIKWNKYEIKYLIETNNKKKYLKKKNLLKHIKYGKVKKVILTNYAIDKKIPIFIIGINHKLITNKHKIFSISSSTVNCLIPLLKIIHREFNIIETLITNIKSINNYLLNKNFFKKIKYNNIYYKLLYNLIPCYEINKYLNNDIIKIIPELNNKINNITFINNNYNLLSLVDLNIKIKNKINYKKLKKILKFYSENELSGILDYNNKKKLLINYLYNKNLSIFDSKLSLILKKNFLKIISWYNNIAYINKLLDLIKYIDNI